MSPLNSYRDVPQLCERLAKEKFFGEVRLIFQSGRLSRVVTEQSFQIQPQENAPNVQPSRY